MKIKSGKRLKPLHLGALVLSLIVILSIIVFSLDVTEGPGEEDEMGRSCVGYLQRNCCSNPGAVRCQEFENEIWTHQEDPFDVCCE